MQLNNILRLDEHASKKNIDSKQWINLQGEDWIIQSVPRQN